jgi:hypothetical protein
MTASAGSTTCSCKNKFVTCQIYLDRFQNCIDVIEHCGGSIGNEPAIVNEILISGGIDPNNASQGEIAAAITVAQEKYLASLFLQGADKGRFGKLIEDLENAYTQGQDNYPKTVQDAYSLLTNWKDKNSTRTSGPTNDGVSVTNVDGQEGDEIVLNTNGGEPMKKGRKVKDQNAHPGITYHKCGIMGHYASDCAQDQDIQQTRTQMLMSGVASGEFDDQEELEFSFYSESSQRSVLLNQPTGLVPRDWILLDNQSTVDVFYNEKLLQNIREADSHMDIHCNAGVTSTNLIGDLKGYGPVWYHPNGIANMHPLPGTNERSTPRYVR